MVVGELPVVVIVVDGWVELVNEVVVVSSTVVVVVSTSVVVVVGSPIVVVVVMNVSFHHP